MTGMPDTVALLKTDWQPGSRVQALQDATHIWAIPMTMTAPWLDVLYGWLSPREQQRAQRIVIAQKRRLAIQARAWLRWLLAGYTNCLPHEITYHYGKLGKPSIASAGQGINFNASDSGRTLLCAFSRRAELGIDIEALPRDVRYALIAKKKYSAAEQHLITALPSNEQAYGFLALWTRKEAYGKALGVGIRYSMNKVNLCRTFDHAEYQYTDHHQKTWHLSQFALADHIACLASSQPSGMHFYTLNTDAVMSGL